MNLVASATAVMLLATTGIALAQPGAEEPPPPPAAGTAVTVTPDDPQQPPVRAVVAPHNEDWNNVSHINGHPVKVGERGDYLYKYKTTNFASNPLGWMFGVYGLSVTQAVSQNIAVRADANLFSNDNDDGYEVGVTLPIYFRRVFQGPFLEGGVMVRQLNEDSMDGPNIGPQVVFGWHWTFDSGANVAFAFGAFRPMNDGKTQDDVEPAGYFRVGYAY